MTRHTRDLIVVGASAGGVEALRDLVAGLPDDLAASVLVVLHLPSDGTSALPAILGRSGPLPAYTAVDGMTLRHATIYVAPPDHHLLVVDGRVSLSQGPVETGRRPAINMLFRSAAIAHGPGVVGVLLSGVLDDGVAGLVSIASHGGKVLVQDPDEALYSAMPRHAMELLAMDHVLPASAMGAVLGELAREEVEPDCVPAPFRLDVHGPAWERALWAAIRTLDEKAELSNRMAEHARERGNAGIATRYEMQAVEALEAAALLREPLDATGRRASEEISEEMRWDADQSASG